jgi:uncharacterized membrane-anchored protein YhcB (DUF1043 family)
MWLASGVWFLAAVTIGMMVARLRREMWSHTFLDLW